MARSILDIVIKLRKEGKADKEVTKDLIKFKSAMMDAAGVAASLAAVGYIIKNAYDFARMGAELELTKARFDRLSESIGTTSGALLDDLGDATKGLYSDFELMDMATQLMSLGLAKTHDEAIRLSRVTAGLNMDMNQLVLALSNMTTMRFDQLGLSVDGFDEKLKELESQGYSTNDAFKEAFLQQAEMQLERVGEAANESIGSFKRLEAQFKNNLDQSKLLAVQGLEPVIRAMSDLMEEENYYLDVLNKITGVGTIWKDTLFEQYRTTRKLTPEMIALVRQYERGQAMTEFYTQAVAGNTETVTENAAAVAEAAKAQSDYYESVLSGAEEMYGEQAEYQEKLQETIAKYGEGSAEVQKLRDEHAAAMAQMQYDLLLTKLSADGLTDAEYEMAVAAGLAFGVFDQEAANAQVAQMELTNAVADGKLSVEDYAAAMSAAMQDGVVTASELRDVLDSIPSSKDIDINVRTNFDNKYGFAAFNQGELDLIGYSQGTNGWMTVPPGYPNDSYPVMLESGERFAVIPAGVSAAPTAGGGMGGGTNITLVVQSPLTIMDEEKARNTLLPLLESAWVELRARGAVR